MSGMQVLLERHECYTNDTSATRVKNFDLDNDTSGNIFSYPYISPCGVESDYNRYSVAVRCTRDNLCKKKLPFFFLH